MYISRRSLIKHAILSAATATPFGSKTVRAEHKEHHASQVIIDRINGIKDKPSTLNCLIPNGCQNNLAPLQSILAEKTGLKLNLDITPLDDINTQLLINRDNKQASHDLALPATFGLPDLARSHAIQALDHLAETHQPKDFQDDTLYTLGDYVEDSRFGYQTDGDTYLMFFNRRFLDNPEAAQRYADTFGEALTLPTTWEQLDRQMQFFHQPQQGLYGGLLFRTLDYLAWEWWVRFHAKGYYPLDDNLEPIIDNDAGVLALEQLITASQYQAPGSRTYGLFENWREYSQGHCYCNIGWGGTQKYLNGTNSKIRQHLLYSPLPGGIIKGKTVRMPYFNWGWNYTLPASAQHPELAYLCALLAVSPDISTRCIRQNGYFDPFRERHYQDKQVRAMYSPEFLRAHYDSMRDSIPDFYLLGQSKYMASLKKYLHLAASGKLAPKTALSMTANHWRNLHHRYGLEAQAAIWKKIKGRYPAHLQPLLS